jgi:hypothetical protein
MFLFFEALFGRLQQLASVADDVLLGKEKIQKVLHFILDMHFILEIAVCGRFRIDQFNSLSQQS